jgi:predicted RNase H-like HicB family nuclease
MSKNIRFYKESDNRWYADLPDFPGLKAELEMVCGADTMLEYFAEGENVVRMHFELNHYEGSDIITLKEQHDEGAGATYHLKTYRGIDLNLDLWLCDVTKFVFGYFPKNIYFNARISIF